MQLRVLRTALGLEDVQQLSQSKNTQEHASKRADEFFKG
jgi:hypothetical protein